MKQAELYMSRCIELAQLGCGYAAPNPMVGCVIVHNNKIIGEGYHERYGEAHAEVNAIAAVNDPFLLNEATLYVNLEPCAHFGKTPPCADLIITHQIPKVVVGCIDSFSEVAGKGIAKMRAAGIDVEVGVLEKESLQLNHRFFTFHTQKRPYVILKWAQSANGMIDIDRTNGEKGIFWITAPETKVLVHKWRHEEAAILVGKNTIINDNPSLTCRVFNGKSPTRIIIDQKLKLDYGRYAVGDRSVLTYILTEKKITGSGNLQFVQPKDFSIQALLFKLYELNLQSVIIEGGKETLTRFIASDLWDEARVLEGDTFISEGVIAPQLNAKSLKKMNLGTDTLKIYTND